VIAAAIGAALALAGAPHVPAGFHATVYASGLVHPTAFSYGPRGYLYVTQEAGSVVSLAPGATHPKVFASGFRESTLGLTWFHGKLYVSDKARVTVLTDANGDRVSDGRRVLIDGLPNGRHQQDAIEAGPDGRLYLGSGSTCDACSESSPRSAAILSFDSNGKNLRVFASGLRNPYGLAFDSHGVLWATDNGRDDHDDKVPDELDRIVAGHRYGWPDCWGTLQGTHCAGTVAPVANLEPHSSADGLAIAPASFAPSMAGDFFVTTWGTYFGTTHGRYVARVHGAGAHATVTRFATGFQHPLPIAFTPTGAMLVGDWQTGVIWRISR
jgi:glucose/arabinose dehydrogenase